jgi:SAM-dependent methyltransferase
VFKQCDAADLSKRSIERARTLAAEQGFDHIHYFVADSNRMALLANTYDAIWISAAMHHFEALEEICRQMREALKPGGLLILYEYIGPNRFQFPARQKEVANLCLQLLPERYRAYSMKPRPALAKRPGRKSGYRWLMRRVFDKLQDGTLLSTTQRYLELRLAAMKSRAPEKAAIDFPSARAVMADDPSEAIRSADILGVLQENFEILEKRDWGGNIVQFLLHGIAGNFSDEDVCSQDLVRMLLEIEDTLIKCGEFKSDFTYIVAQPKAKTMN